MKLLEPFPGQCGLRVGLSWPISSWLGRFNWPAFCQEEGPQSCTDKGNLTDGNNDLKEECNSIAVLSPARTKAATSTAPGSQKVEFSVPLSSNFPETT